MKGKGYKLQRMALFDNLLPAIGKRGECALCEHVLIKRSSRLYYCEDCHAVYVMQENGLLDYIGRRAA